MIAHPLSRRTLIRGLAAAVAAFPGLLAAAAPGPVRAAENRDPRGWRGARWGMSDGDLRRAFGAAVSALPSAWDYGGAYARLQIAAVEVGGLTFRALFQMNRADDRLQQVLLERRGPLPDAAFAALLATLENTYGPANRLCRPVPEASSVRQAEVVWAFPDTTLHLVLLDFQSPGLLYEDPNDSIDPLRPFSDSRRIVRRFLPRRLLLRYHPSARRDLMAPGSRCVER